MQATTTLRRAVCIGATVLALTAAGKANEQRTGVDSPYC